MTLIPEFKIGLLNAWILVLFFNLFIMIFSYSINKEGFKRGAERSWVGKKEKILMMFSAFFWYGMLLVSFWLPLKIGTTLFYTGMIIYVIGLLFHSVASVNYVTAPFDKPITQGMYKLSRNPIYFLNTICLLGVALASSSSVLLAMLIVYALIMHFIVIAEEKYCMEKYGDAYREYMKKTPRYFLFF